MTDTALATRVAATAIVAAVAVPGGAWVTGDGDVWIEYSGHYGIAVGMFVDGKVAVDGEIYLSDELDAVPDVGGVAFARDIRAVAAQLVAAHLCVPSGNRDDMGGSEAIAAVLWTARRIAAYVERGPSTLA